MRIDVNTYLRVFAELVEEVDGKLAVRASSPSSSRSMSKGRSGTPDSAETLLSPGPITCPVLLAQQESSDCSPLQRMRHKLSVFRAFCLDWEGELQRLEA